MDGAAVVGAGVAVTDEGGVDVAVVDGGAAGVLPPEQPATINADIMASSADRLIPRAYLRVHGRL